MPKPTGPNFDRAHEQQAESGAIIPYISKSRVIQYVKNPYHYYLKYIMGMREPETYPMFRGTQVHTAIETYYVNVCAVWENEGAVYEDVLKYLPRDVTLWADWIEPYISNFLCWEQRRLDHCLATGRADAFAPLGIEEEVWDWDREIPLMGYADVVYHAASVPDDLVPESEGAVVVDVKTGKSLSARKYKDKPGSILMELDYYALLFRDEYDVVAVGGLYPRDDDFIVDVPRPERQAEIESIIEEMLAAGTDRENYPVEENPLCKWGPNDDQQSYFYKICPCKWGTESGPGPTYCDDDKQPLN